MTIFVKHNFINCMPYFEFIVNIMNLGMQCLNNSNQEALTINKKLNK